MKKFSVLVNDYLMTSEPLKPELEVQLLPDLPVVVLCT